MKNKKYEEDFDLLEQLANLANKKNLTEIEFKKKYKDENEIFIKISSLSKVGILIYLVDGSDVYKKFFNFLMTYKNQLTFKILKSFASKAGSKIKDFDNQINLKKVNSVIANNLLLAEKLSINGTPSFIIGNSIIRGFISSEELQEIIDNFRKKQ